jgi:putative transcriptional regulator
VAKARKTKRKAPLTGKARLRAEIVEITQGMHRAGLVDDAELEKTTIAMLGRDAWPKIEKLAPAQIAKLRERVGVSQAVLAGFLNVAVNTVSQWERGERRPTGAALKLLHVVSTKGLDAVR